MTATRALETEATGPLKGVRILDMTSVVFGAYATQMLGDLGADVIKVEFPAGRRGGGGDIMRWAGRVPEGAPLDLGPIYMTLNRNKPSMLLDLREEAANSALCALIETCDVFCASERPGPRLPQRKPHRRWRLHGVGVRLKLYFDRMADDLGLRSHLHTFATWDGDPYHSGIAPAK